MDRMDFQQALRHCHNEEIIALMLEYCTAALACWTILLNCFSNVLPDAPQYIGISSDSWHRCSDFFCPLVFDVSVCCLCSVQITVNSCCDRYWKPHFHQPQGGLPQYSLYSYPIRFSLSSFFSSLKEVLPPSYVSPWQRPWLSCLLSLHWWFLSGYVGIRLFELGSQL